MECLTLFMEVNVSFSPDVGGAPKPIRVDLAAISVSLELSRATWLVTSLSPGAGRRCPGTSCAVVMPRACSTDLLTYGRELGRAPASCSPSW